MCRSTRSGALRTAVTAGSRTSKDLPWSACLRSPSTSKRPHNTRRSKMRNPWSWHAPLDPDCPDNPLNNFFDDPMTQECGCADEIADDLERRHAAKCKRCQEFGAANIEVVGP